jgi:hypothetical protein
LGAAAVNGTNSRGGFIKSYGGFGKSRLTGIVWVQPDNARTSKLITIYFIAYSNFPVALTTNSVAKLIAQHSC